MLAPALTGHALTVVVVLESVVVISHPTVVLVEVPHDVVADEPDTEDTVQTSTRS